MAKLGGNLEVPKTIKLFVAGEFPRTESGRTYAIHRKGSGPLYANLCLASRKDLRTSVTAAQEALKGWDSRSAYNRSQILYRMAEIFESRRGSFQEILTSVFGLTPTKSQSEIHAAIDLLVYFAGFVDKYQQIVGSVNPVNGPHHNFTSPEAVGVVGGLFSDKDSLSQVVGHLASIIASGNTVVALLPGHLGVFVAELGEVFATSDLPKGVVNLLSGSAQELYEQFGSHMEIQSLFCSHPTDEQRSKMRALGVENMKRFRELGNSEFTVENILNFVEYKTVWHPVEY